MVKSKFKPIQEKESGSRPEGRILRTGLPVGTVAPDFHLVSLAGRIVTLEQFRGQRVLIVFSDPQCGPCMELLPKLVKLHHKIPFIEIIIISRRGIEENQNKFEHYPISIHVVRQEHWEISLNYGFFYTPSAFLLDADGKTSAPAAVGGDAIRSLLVGAAISSLLEHVPA